MVIASCHNLLKTLFKGSSTNEETINVRLSDKNTSVCLSDRATI